MYKNEAVNFSNFFHTSFITKRKGDELGHKLCFQMVRDISNLENFFASFEGEEGEGSSGWKKDVEQSKSRDWFLHDRTYIKKE